MKVLCLFLLGAVCLEASELCKKIFEDQGLSKNLNETIAHAIHSMTVEELKKFHPLATKDNSIPTVNPRLNVEDKKVLNYAPEEKIGSDFSGDAMNTIDHILSGLGSSSDGLGPNWSPVKQIVHKFHMTDLWDRVLLVYKEIPQVDGELCECLTDTESNGVQESVEWIARHYKTGTILFTLLNRPIPKLVDAKSWKVWKMRLLHYYTPAALRDAALYLKCAVAHWDL